MPETQGTLGIAFDLALRDSTEATIHRAWGNDSTLGRTPIANILAQNTSIAPVVDVSLGRVHDLQDVANGTFLIGEHAPGFEAVEQAPVLPQTIVGRWSTVVDSFSVNGQNFTFTTKPKSQGVPANKLFAFMDTGTALPEIPQDAVDFIYGSIPGSVQNNGIWYLPCSNAANLTWYIGYVCVMNLVRQ